MTDVMRQAMQNLDAEDAERRKTQAAGEQYSFVMPACPECGSSKSDLVFFDTDSGIFTMHCKDRGHNFTVQPT